MVDYVESAPWAIQGYTKKSDYDAVFANTVRGHDEFAVDHNYAASGAATGTHNGIALYTAQGSTAAAAATYSLFNLTGFTAPEGTVWKCFVSVLDNAPAQLYHEFLIDSNLSNHHYQIASEWPITIVGHWGQQTLNYTTRNLAATHFYIETIFDKIAQTLTVTLTTKFAVAAHYNAALIKLAV